MSKWVDPKPVEAGAILAPAIIGSSTGRDFAALHLILADLQFAHECLVAADKIGVPDHTDLSSRSLIFSGAVAYARPFKTGVREIKLNIEMFAEVAGVDPDCHSHLIALRDKHVAHSVNEFERCSTVAIMVQPPGGDWRYGGAIGTIEQHSVGLNRTMVQFAVSHITAMIGFLSDTIEKKRVELNAEFATRIVADGRWEMAPLYTVSDRTKIATRR